MFGKPLFLSSGSSSEAQDSKPATGTFASLATGVPSTSKFFGTKSQPVQFGSFLSGQTASAGGFGSLFGNAQREKSPKTFDVPENSIENKVEEKSSSNSNIFDRTSFGPTVKPLVVDTTKLSNSKPKVKSPGKFAVGSLFQNQTSLVKRRSSTSATSKVDSAQLQTCTTIKLQNLPQEINDKAVLMRHFEQFGTVTKISVRPKSETALIEFSDHESAKKAKEAPFNLMPEVQVKVHYVLPSALIRTAMSPVSPEQPTKGDQDKIILRQARFLPTDQSDDKLLFGQKKLSTQPSSVVFGEKPIFGKIPYIPAPKVASAGYDVSNIVDSGTGLASVENIRTLVSQLRGLIGRQAVSTHEKWQLLEQRDKIIRKYRAKVNDVSQAAVFHGTCPDMCPEKERYRREVQMLLHSYEMCDSSVDQMRAVKDYARSSADQEEPLPHELRSADILEKTMHYLISQIVTNEPNESSQLASWYDFLWNRTRAIRKDITQQMLSDSAAIDLIEKCARLHIYAAYRLCETGIGAFDQKMNTEILSQITRQALIYKQSVRQSEPIIFALRLCSAMQNNNYVSFFRLIRQKATFLQACLAHRYFNHVRSEAIKVMVRAYGASASQLPLGDLVNLLHFENGQEVAAFCSNFGLPCTTSAAFGAASTTFVMFNRTIFIEPEAPPPSRHSSLLVDNKRTCSTAEMINGATIRPFDFIDPVISFDVDHRYTNDCVVRKFLDSVQNEFPIDQLGSVSNSSTSGRVNQTDNVERALLEEKMADELADELICSAVSDICKTCCQRSFIQMLAESCFSHLVSDSIKKYVDEAYNKARQLNIEKQKKRQEISALIDQVASDLSVEMVSSVCTSCLREIAEKEYK